MMMKVVLSAALAAGLASTAALGADLVAKAPPMPPAAPVPSWDVAFGSALMSDYNFRGITQSAHKPSVAAYFEPRYNVNSNFQLYAGISGESIDFPNRAAAEIDFYGGFRPTFDKLALDFGFWYYYYPGGQCFNANAPPGGGTFGADCVANADPVTLGLPLNGNVIKKDLSFWEVYGKGTYTFNDNLSVGGSFYYSPSVLNSGADGKFLAGNVKFTAPSTWFASGWGAYASGDIGYWWLGTSDSFYGVTGFPNGIKYADYATWDLGLGITYKIFTLDLRYYDTNLSAGDCNAFTSDHTATAIGNVTPINPGGIGSNWCGAAYIAKFSVDTTLNAYK